MSGRSLDWNAVSMRERERGREGGGREREEGREEGGEEEREGYRDSMVEEQEISTEGKPL